jgi:hypothetical protein
MVSPYRVKKDVKKSRDSKARLHKIRRAEAFIKESEKLSDIEDRGHSPTSVDDAYLVAQVERRGLGVTKRKKKRRGRKRKNTRRKK